MDIAMVSITTWTDTMKVETIMDVLSTNNTAQIGNVLIPMEGGLEQFALKQQLLQQLSQLRIIVTQD